MRCTIVAPGSRGDVQPLVVLAAHLQHAGFDVRFATHGDFEPSIREIGAEFFPMTGKSVMFYGGVGGMSVRDRTRDPNDFVSFFNRYLLIFLRKLLEESFIACEDADFVIGWPWIRFAPSIAERLKIPVLIGAGCPLLYFPTWKYPNPFQGPRDPRFGPLYNRWSWRWAMTMTKMGQAEVDRWRDKVLGLPPMSWSEEMRQLRRAPHLFGYSGKVLPKPFDWPDSVHVTGWWFKEQGAWQPPPELEAFLAAGDKPIGIGFSSQVSRKSDDITSMFVEALERTNKRAVMITGFGGLKDAPVSDRLFAIPTVPYAWLLPRLAAMVHHGGSGSTGDTVRAGIPGFAVPFGYDQYLWARRISDIGIAAPPILPDKITVPKLVDRIRKATEDEKMRRRAELMAEEVRAEDGIGNALRVIEQAVAPFRKTKGTVVPLLAANQR